MKSFSEWADILWDASGYLGYLWMADKFCKKYLGSSRAKDLLFVFFSFGGWLFLSVWNRRYPVPHILFTMLNHVLFVGLLLLLFQAGWEKKVLAASMLTVAVKLVTNIASAFLCCLVLVFLHTVKKIPTPLVGDWAGGVITFLSFFLAMAAVCWMSKHLASVFCKKSEKWYVVLAVPLLLLVVMFDVVEWGACHGIMARSGGNMGLYYDQIFSHMQFLILAALALAAAGFYVFGMDRIDLEQRKNSQYHSQIAVYKMLTEQYRQSERLRHDMKNHIIALSGLCQSKEWEKLGSYLKNMEERSLYDCGDLTGNKAVDALLYEKQRRAKEGEIKWECDVQIPKECSINTFDLCVLFGNLLDNALEACERMQDTESRFVNVQTRRIKKCFLLEVKNSMEEAEKYSDRSERKKNAQEHGIGLLNVGDVVRKYHGVMHDEAAEGIFVLSVLIPLPDAVYDVKTTV